MSECRGVVEHDNVTPRDDRRKVGRAVDQLGSAQRKRRLLPHLAGTVGEPRRGADHAIAVGRERRQPLAKLTRVALDAPDLGAYSRPRVDRNGHRHAADQSSEIRRRTANPTPTNPAPAANPSQASKPVTGSEPEWLDEDVVLELAPVASVGDGLNDPVAPVLGAIGVVVGCAAGVVVGAVVADVVDLVVFAPPPASGSVYWLSPAEGPFDARATAGGTIATSKARARQQALMSSARTHVASIARTYAAARLQRPPSRPRAGSDPRGAGRRR